MKYGDLAFRALVYMAWCQHVTTARGELTSLEQGDRVAYSGDMIRAVAFGWGWLPG